MKRSIRLSALISLLCVVGNSYSFSSTCLQPVPDKNQIQNLGNIIDLALSCNPSTRIAWAQAQAAEANIGISESSYWPQLSLQFNSNQSYASTNSIASINNTSRFSYGPGLTLNYLIWDFGNRAQTSKAARLKWQIAKFNQNSVTQQIILQVTQAYYQVAAQKALLIATKQSVKENRLNLISAKLLHTQGMATIGDVYQAKSAFSQAMTALQQAQGNYAIAQGQLNNIIGIPITTSLTLADLTTHTKAQAIMLSVQQLLNSAKQHRPDLLAAKTQLEASQAQLIAVRSQAWPIVQLSATHSLTYPTSVNTSGYTRNLMLTISIPLFAGFAQTNAIKQAQANLEQAHAQRDQVDNQVALEVWQAYYLLRATDKSLSSTQDAFISSQQAAKQAYGQYRAGVGNILNVLSTQTTLSKVRTQLIQAKLDWHASLVQLAAKVGTLDQNAAREIAE